MTKAPRPWLVLPHGPFEKLEENLWTVEAELPRSPQMKRRAHFVRLSSGAIVAHPGICLDDAAMRELQAWGEIAFVIVPNRFHRLDAHAWRERFPHAKFVCPPACRASVEEAVRIDGDLSLIPTDPSLAIHAAEGWKDAEPILQVRSGPRVSLCFSDVVMNLTRMTGLEGFIFKLIGSAGELRVTRLARLLQLQNAAALKAQLLALADAPDLVRLVPCHGEIVDAGAAASLRAAANRL